MAEQWAASAGLRTACIDGGRDGSGGRDAGVAAAERAAARVTGERSKGEREAASWGGGPPCPPEERGGPAAWRRGEVDTAAWPAVMPLWATGMAYLRKPPQHLFPFLFSFKFWKQQPLPI